VGTGLIAILAVLFVSWFLYAIYVLEPNEANTSAIGLVNSTLMVLLAVVSIAYARSVWRRSYGIHDQQGKLRAFTGFMVIYPILIAVLLPYALIFTLFAFALQYMNSLFSRPFAYSPSASATKQKGHG
jgi:hypothetical protein